MRRIVAAGAVAVGAVVGLSTAGEARAQLQPPPRMQGQPQPAPAQPIWNPFAPATPANPATGQYAGTSATQQRLDASDQDSSGRGLEVAWVNVEGGGSALVGSGSTEGGGTVGAGAGVRFVSWTLGVRARFSPYADTKLLQVAGEAGWHIPIGSWDPYAKLRVGYAHASFSGVDASTSGLDLGLGVGADYYLSALFSLGLEASGDYLMFDAKAGMLAGTAHVGLHFDL